MVEGVAGGRVAGPGRRILCSTAEQGTSVKVGTTPLIKEVALAWGMRL